ncbi:MAG TPA: hypothetical protein PLB32_07425 [Acidobacteriota bacterium]|nr:hypothetical protein [Acidobacteriota bacterium]
MQKFWKNLFVKSRLGVAQTSYLRPQEVLGVLLALVVGGGVIYFHINYLGPLYSQMVESDRKLATLGSDVDRLKTEVKRKKVDTEKFDIAMEKLKDFEVSYLSDKQNGQVKLINEINELAAKNQVRLTDGMEFELAKVELPSVEGQKTRRLTTSDQTKEQLAYPGIVLKFDVVGPYYNMRRFIKAVEASKQFMLIQLGELSSENVKEGGGADIVQVSFQITAFFQRGD